MNAISRKNQDEEDDLRNAHTKRSPDIVEDLRRGITRRNPDITSDFDEDISKKENWYQINNIGVSGVENFHEMVQAQSAKQALGIYVGASYKDYEITETPKNGKVYTTATDREEISPFYGSYYEVSQMAINSPVKNILLYYGDFADYLLAIQSRTSTRPRAEYEQWLQRFNFTPDFKMEMEWFVQEVVCSQEAVDSLAAASKKDPLLAETVLDPKVLENLGEYHYGALARDLEADPKHISDIIAGKFDLKSHFLDLDKQYVREVVNTRDPMSKIESLDFAAARILARESHAMYSTIQKDLGYIDSLEAAPAGTREKINEAYEKKLAWSQDKPRAYICSPLGAADHAGIRQNMLAARRYCDVAERNMLVVGKAPHAWLPEFLDDHNPIERQIGLDVGAGMLRSADCCLVCGDRISAGMRSEIEQAGQLGITVYTFNEKTNAAVQEILGQDKKHTNIAPHVSSDLRLLSKAPEEVNAMRLDKTDLRLPDLSQSPSMQKAFQRRFDAELETLSQYAGYRQSRDRGGDTIRMYEEQMQGIEDKIVSAAVHSGMNKEESQALLKSALEAQQNTKQTALGKDKKADPNPTNEKGRGR